MINYKNYYLILFEDSKNQLVEVDKVELVANLGVYYSGPWELESLKWGDSVVSLRQNDEKYQVPQAIRVFWKESLTKEIYEKETSLEDTKIDNEDIIFVGLSHLGDISVWLKSQSTISLIFKEISKESIFYCRMKQYMYRLLLILWDEKTTNISMFKVKRFDGTSDDLIFNGTATKYHRNGVPYIFKTEMDCDGHYSVNLWLEEEEIISIFERFYGAHPDTKADFIIRFDAENKRYELSLFRQGLKEPVIIPESAYQMIVFKNKFEDYRSENYNQPRGAWIW